MASPSDEAFLTLHSFALIFEISGYLGQEYLREVGDIERISIQNLFILVMLGYKMYLGPLGIKLLRGEDQSLLFESILLNYISK